MRTWEGRQNGAIHYYALDLPANTVRGLFNASGGVTHQYGYGPFGEVQSTSGSPANPLRFAARELDATAGLYYVRARWYDPSMGRFVSEDPIGLASGINDYAYALNDPVNLSDPSGLIPCTEPWIGTTLTIISQVGGCEPWHSSFFTSSIDRRFTLSGAQSAFAGAVFGGREDDGSLTDLGPGPYPPIPNCPNTTPFERYLARQADRRSNLSGTKEGYFVSRGPGPLLGSSSMDGPGVIKTATTIGARPPFWAGTQIHNHPSGGGISEADSAVAHAYGIRVVSGSARTNVFGAVNPGGTRSTCVTPD
jgi:RHS repeat-associated protein